MTRRFAVLLATLVLAPGTSAQVVSRPASSDTLAAPARPATGVPLTLDQAVLRALDQSEEVGLAEAQIDLAEAQIRQARSALFPQINGTFRYNETIQSSSNIGGGMSADTTQGFMPNPNAPLPDRVTYLEQNAGLAVADALGGLFAGLPFGLQNTYTATVTGTQALFDPQALAALSVSRHFRDAAALTLTEEQADIRLRVEQAYVQALVARELVAISEAAIEQAEAFLANERLFLQAGQKSELDVLRAEVEVENLRPQIVQAQNAAQLAVLDLKRLANIPFAQTVLLTTALTVPPADAVPDLDVEAVVAGRASVLAATEQVRIREGQVRFERAAYLPRLSLQSSYGQTRFADNVFDAFGGYRPDFTVGFTLSVPIFNGGRRSAQVQQARVELRQAELQLTQLRESVQLQTEQALGEKRRALSLIAARRRTVDQATEVFRLSRLAYDQGVITQLQVTDARTALLQARSNLVQALADFYLADSNLLRAQTSVGTVGLGLVIPTGDSLPAMDASSGSVTPGSTVPDATVPRTPTAPAPPRP